jgi:16S rRNA (guanine527-N7)-methyltransferase
MSDARLQALLAGSGRLGLELQGDAAARLLAYLDLLQRWNATYNLTSVRDPDQMLTQHLLDCLAVVAPMRRMLGGDPARVLDVGSGGGLPGVVLAAMCPTSKVICVDTVGKKAAFVRQAAMELGLPNLEGEHARVEKLRAPAFDLVTSRAFASLADFVSLTRQHVAAGGAWMAMKGKPPEAEMSALPPDIEMFHVEHLDVPGLAAERCLVWMRPRAG